MRVFDGALPTETEESKNVAREIVSVSASSTTEAAGPSIQVTHAPTLIASHTPVPLLSNKEIEELKASYEKKITALKSQLELKVEVPVNKEIDDNNDDFVPEDKEELDRLRNENETLKVELESLRATINAHNAKSSDSESEIASLKNKITELQNALNESVRFILYYSDISTTFYSLF